MDFTLKNKSDIIGTHWIQFNFCKTAEEFEYWSDNSKYLDEYSYNFYTDIFETIADNFVYYGNTNYDKEQLRKLKTGIEDRIKTIDNLKTLQEIIKFSKKTSNALNLTQDIEGFYNKQNRQLGKLLNSIKKLGHDLVSLIDNCIQQDKVLWVLGL